MPRYGGRGTRTPKCLRTAVFKTAALPIRSSPPGTKASRFVLLLLVLVATPLSAQNAPVRTSITGVITDSVSGKTLKGAVVYFTSRDSEVQSDKAGRFKIERRSSDD